MTVRRRAALWAVAASTIQACAANTAQLQVVRLQQLAGAGDRTVRHLDVSGDGQISDADRQVFESLEKQARALLPRGSHEAVWSLNAAAAFRGVVADGAGVSPAAAPSERLGELMVESSWAAMQVRTLMAIGVNAASDATVGGSLQRALLGYSSDVMAPASLCAGISANALAGLERAGMARVAVFDLDNTVWAGDITNAFLLALAASGTISAAATADLRAFVATLPEVDPAQLPSADVVALADLVHSRLTDETLAPHLRLNIAQGFFRVLALLRGLTPMQVAPLVSRVLEVGVGPYGPWLERVFASSDGCGMRDIMQALRASGVDVYVMSATLDVLARAAASSLGIPPERVRASVPAVDEQGRYTGELAQEVYYTKIGVLRQWLPAVPLFVFGDSPVSDFDMLREALVAGFMVNPRLPLLVRDSSEAGGRLVALHFDGVVGAKVAAPLE